ncbi:MAG: TetR/AcrR family transcriptional regulator [Caldilineaceae bacterium]|nr:TetR/AcrR family transcriptional regulator [Caldilineaceae bacterium]
MTDAHETTVDPRVRRTRRLLQQAFRELLAEKRFQAISVQDIAERATVNRATFYAHFDDKFALVDSLIRDEFQECLAKEIAITSALTPGNLCLLCLTVFNYLAYVDTHCSLTDTQFASRFAMAVHQELYVFILAWLKQGLRGDAPQRTRLEATATAMSWSIYGAGIQWGRGVFSHTAEELATQLVEVFSDGVMPATAALMATQQVQHDEWRNGS